MTDIELLLLYDTDADKAIKETIRLYLPYVRAIVNDKLSAFSKEDIEECISDIFTGFWHGYQKVDLSRGSVRAYLCVLSKSKALRRREQLIRRQTIEGDKLPDEHADKPNELFKEELYETLSLLNDDDRKLIIMKYYLGLKYKEIAKQLKISCDAAKARTRRALEKLRSRMGGIDDEL